MGLFGKNKNIDLEEGHNNNLFSDDDDYITPIQHRIITGESRVTAPHAITADELMGTAENIPMHSNVNRTSNSVYESIKEQNKNAELTSFGDDYVPSWAQGSTEESFSSFSGRVKPEMTDEEMAVAAKRAEEILSATNVRTESVFVEDEKPALEILTETVEDSESYEVDQESSISEGDTASSFLERCKMAVKGVLPQEETTTPEVIPMEAVKIEEDLQEQTETAPKSEAFEDVVRRIKNETDEISAEPQISEVHEIAEEEISPREVKVEVEVIPEDAPDKIMHSAPLPTMVIPPVPATPVVPTAISGDVKVYGRVVNGKVIEQTPEGDAQVSDLIRAQKEAEQTRVIGELESTRMFDGLDDVLAQRADASFNEAVGEYEGEEEEEKLTPYYETEDLDLKDIEDYKDLNDAAKLRTDYQQRKSSAALKTTVSFIAFAVMLILSLPIMDLMSATVGGSISIVLLLVSLVINGDIFASFKKMFNAPEFDCCVGLVAVVSLVQTAVSAFGYNGQYAYLAAYAALLLAINRYTKLAKIKRIEKGLEKIANSEEKNTICLADGTASRVISSGAVEGEVVGIISKKAVNVQGFIKSSSYKSPFDLKVKVLMLVGVIVSALGGIIAGVIAGLGAGITVLAALLCLAFPVSSLLSAEMPMNRIANRLFEKGAVLAGFKGAYDINLSNIVAVKTSDLFPEGTVKLYNMKTLSENEIGQTLTAAAAVAYAAESPLANVFREMVGISSENELPKVNGVQYEDKMGISGWIGDNTVLIGNRNLMQGHSVPVPPAAVDQKILKAGYFPVYIACKGVPCLLFVVKYEVDPEIQNELLKLCNTGMTVLVNPQDPNVSEAMICDYFGIPDDALKVMNHNGRVMYERRTKPEETVKAPAVCGKNVTGLFATITASIRISSIIAVLTAIYIVAAALGGVLLLYFGVLGKLSLVTSFALTVYQVVFMLISTIAMKVKDRQ